MVPTTDGKLTIRTLINPTQIGGNAVLKATVHGIRERKLTAGACVATSKVTSDKPYSLRRLLSWPGLVITNVAFALAAGFVNVVDQTSAAFTAVKNTAFGWTNYFGFQAEERITPAAFFSRILSAIGLDAAAYLPQIQAKFSTLYPQISWGEPIKLSMLVRSICAIPGNFERQLSLGAFMQCLLGSYNLGVNFMMLDETFGSLPASAVATGIEAKNQALASSIWAGYTPEQINELPAVVVGEPFKQVQDGVVRTDAVVMVYNDRYGKFVVVGVATNLSTDVLDVTYVDPKADSQGFIGTILNTVLAGPEFAPESIGLDAKCLSVKLDYQRNLTVRVRIVEHIAEAQGNTEAKAKLQAIKKAIESGRTEKAETDLNDLAYAGIERVTTPSTSSVLNSGLAAAAIEAAIWLANHQSEVVDVTSPVAIGGVSRQTALVS